MVYNSNDNFDTYYFSVFEMDMFYYVMKVIFLLTT